MKKIIYLQILLATLSFSDNMAKAQTEITEKDLFALEDMTIELASRHLEPTNRAPAIVSVITDTQIRNMGARNISEVLRTVPGLGILQHWVGYKKIEVRGVTSDMSEGILLLINGHRENAVFYGSSFVIFDDMSLDNVKKIEIVRGPGSALYGDNAFLAVINVITKNAEQSKGFQVRAGGGSFDTQKANILFGADQYKLKVNGSFDYYNTHGPRLHVQEDGATALDKLLGTNASLAPGKTTDWKEKYDSRIQFNYGDFTLWAQYTDKKLGPYVGIAYALDEEGTQEWKNYIGDMSFSRDISKNLNVKARLYYDQFELEQKWVLFSAGFLGLYPDGMRGTPIVKDRTAGSEASASYMASNHNIVVGGKYEKTEQYDAFHSTNFNPNTNLPIGGGFQRQDEFPFNRTSDRKSLGLYVQDEWAITDEIELTWGVRHDQYSDFGNTTNPRVGFIWDFNVAGTVKFLYGQAYRAPTFIELYNENNPAVLGNKNLTAEKIKTFEFGFDYKLTKQINASMNFFKNGITDKIVLRSNSSGSQYANVGNVNATGVEMEIKVKWDEKSYGYANYSYNFARNLETQAVLHDVSRHKGNIGLNYALLKFLNANTNIFMTGSKSREEGDTRGAIPAFALVDLSLIWGNFFKSMEIRTSVYNLLNQKYTDPAPKDKNLPEDFPEPGIEYLVELSYNF